MQNFNNANDGFANNPPMHSLSDLAQPYQYQPQQQQAPVNQGQQPIEQAPNVGHRQPQQSNSDFDDEMRKKAFDTQQNLMNRENILKEEYIKAKETEFARTKELLTDRLQVADYIHSQAIANGDDKLRDEMLAKKIALQEESRQYDGHYDQFKKQSELLLEDRPELLDYSPKYEESRPEDHESQARNYFRKQNNWYDFESNHYNQDLVRTASEIEKQMINEYQLKNMGQYLESPEYFADLRSRIFNKYGIQEEPNQMSQQPPSPYMPPQQQQQPNYMPQPQQPAQNYFVPPQVPQMNNNPQMMPPQYQPMYQQTPVQGNPNQAYNMGNPYPNAQSPNLINQRMGPPVAGVNNTMAPQGPQFNGAANQEMHSQKAFEIFDAALPSHMRGMNHDDKVKFFQTAIKNQGRVR